MLRCVTDWVAKRFSSIASRLVFVLLTTGILAFSALGSLTSVRVNIALQRQAEALSQFSERQLAVRLDGEAQLARARFEELGKEVASRAREIAVRADIGQAIETQNEVTIRELLHGIAQTLELDRLLAFNKQGEILASDSYLSLIQISRLVQSSAIYAPLIGVLSSEYASSKLSLNRCPALDGSSAMSCSLQPRSHFIGYQSIKEIRESFADILQLKNRSIAHIAIEPVFEEFGDVIGALVAIRTVGRSEKTLENFTTLANAGVIIVRGREVVSATGPQEVSFANEATGGAGLLMSTDGQHVARCVPYERTLKVCTFTDANVAAASRDQIFRIGAEQTESVMFQFLMLTAITLAALIIALLLVVRHTTQGLSQLASAAQGVAQGNLNVRIAPAGVGEVYSLSLAFKRMLTHLRSNVRRIERLAYVDAVTGLPNREKVRIDASELIKSIDSGLVLFIDLDGFKSVNDTFGHNTGDTLLKHVANRLSSHFKTLSERYSFERKVIGRMGGDEFVVVLPINKSIELSRLAQTIIDNVNQPFDIGGSQVSVGTSIGIAVFPQDGRDYQTLLANADLAMYAAKREGRNGFAFFTPDLAEKAKRRLRLETDLKVAVQSESLKVHYQPKVECRSGQIRGVEALVRWKHPEFGDISPATFLRIAGEIGLISQIDLFVISQSINEVGSLNQAGANLRLSVNITAVEIEDARFMDNVVTLIEKQGFPPTHLELELTESIALQNPEIVSHRVKRLRQMGVRFAIDDFGAGYSNLATLARLPIDTLKLDRSLVSGVTNDPEKQSITRVAFGLAAELGLDSVAEGVETLEEYNYVAGKGATFAQGFFCSPAVSVTDLAALIGSCNLGPFIPPKQQSVSAA